MSPIVDRFRETFQRLGADSLELLDELYGAEIVFEDPLHTVRGLDALRNYFATLYEGVVSCRFDFHEELVVDGRASLTWTMHLEHRRFHKGRIIEVAGASFIHFGDKVEFHRDYFDVGQLVYERVPLLGGLVRAVKRRVGSA